jgi:hypothetical protein
VVIGSHEFDLRRGLGTERKRDGSTAVSSMLSTAPPTLKWSLPLSGVPSGALTTICCSSSATR